MTEEEYFRKNYPDSCWGDRPLSPYWDYFQDGVEFGERQSEENITELEAQIEKMKCCANCVRYFADCKMEDIAEEEYLRANAFCKHWELKE